MWPRAIDPRARRYIFHELRNDQHAIGSFLDYLAETLEERPDIARSLLPETLLVQLGEARCHATHAAQVITNILDVTKLQLNQLVLPTEQPFELLTLCNECIKLVVHLVRTKPIKLNLECCFTEAPPSLKGAPDHLKQVLLNLLTNSIKYTDAGSVTLRVRHQALHGPPQPVISTATATSLPTQASPANRADAGALGFVAAHAPTEGKGEAATAASTGMAESAGQESARVKLLFEVADTGVGVPIEQRETIFESYIQGPRAGTGLGLSFCKEMVKLMGGTLWLESTEHPYSTDGSSGGGSTFGLSIVVDVGRPIDATKSATVGDPGPAEPDAPAPVPGLATVIPSGLRVLIADDLNMNRMVLKRRLTRNLPNPQFTEAKTGEEALEHLMAGDIDVAFLDEHMSQDGLKGTDVSRRVRQAESEGSGEDESSGSASPTCARSVNPLARRAHRVALIGCTGNADAGFNKYALESGQDFVIGKPFPANFDARTTEILRAHFCAGA